MKNKICVINKDWGCTIGSKENCVLKPRDCGYSVQLYTDPVYETNDIIIAFGGRFNIYDTKGHTCILPNGYLIDEFREFMIKTYGQAVTLREFGEKIQDINKYGTNELYQNKSGKSVATELKDLVASEQAHHNMNFDEFVECWLSPPKEYKKRPLSIPLPIKGDDLIIMPLDIDEKIKKGLSIISDSLKEANSIDDRISYVVEIKTSLKTVLPVPADNISIEITND